jgi:hypothetical protein
MLILDLISKISKRESLNETSFKLFLLGIGIVLGFVDIL